MLRDDQGGPAPWWLPLAGALFALIPAALLTWRGVTWLGGDCSCAGGALPEWSGWLLLALAAPFYVAAAALVLRLRR